MIAFATLIFAQVAAPAPLAPSETMLNPVSVATIKTRLPALQASVSQTPAGAWLCALNASTGSVYIDDRMCQSTVICTIRQNRGVEDFARCMRDEQKDMLDDYSDALKR